ncbi:hypothetical protein M0804_004614 [Polistes exclamans]|nr:hypothetical protein M0804_004614 [Polistes exclamans]
MIVLVLVYPVMVCQYTSSGSCNSVSGAAGGLNFNRVQRFTYVSHYTGPRLSHCLEVYERNRERGKDGMREIEMKIEKDRENGHGPNEDANFEPLGHVLVSD